MQPTQPLDELTTATADANGKVTFTFTKPPLGMVWTGALNIPKAPPGSDFTATINGDEKLSWAANAISGNVQALNAPMAVVGHGLVPGTQYRCRFTGRAEDETRMPSIPPPTMAAAAGVQTAGVLIKGLTTGSLAFTQPLAMPYRSIRFFACGIGSYTVIVTGLTSGIIYFTGVLNGETYETILVDPAADPLISISVTTSAAWLVTAQLTDEEVEVVGPSGGPVITDATIVGPLDGAGHVETDPLPDTTGLGKSGVETLATGGTQQAFAATYVPSYGVTIRYVAVGGSGFANIGFTSGIALSEQLANRETVSFPWSVALSGIHWISTNTNDTLEWLAV